MAADYTQPLTVNKSVRFYDGQFLQDQDFIDEQKYQSARRNRHQRTLHVAGVAEGMTVYTPANSTFQVKVRAGVAIDAHGRQIVQPKTSSPIDLANAAGTSRWLYVAYDQKPVDKQASGQGVEGETRWLESPYFFAANKLLGVDDTYSGTDWNDYLVKTEGPPPPVLLAKLTIDGAGKVTIDKTVRRYSGLRLPGPGKDSLAPVLRSDSAGNVGLWLVNKKDLSERLTVSAQGNVGINSLAPTAALEIGSTLKATQNGQALVGLKIAPTFDENGRSNVRKHGLIVTDGNVGIGTTDPLQILDVNGRINVANGVIQSGGDAITNTSDLGLYSRIDGRWMRFVTNDGPIRFFSDDGKGETPNLTINSNGNVGIGTASPGEKLDVSGNALISGNLTVDSNTLHVDSTNNRVGIGTTSPDAKLEVTAPSSGVTLKLGRKTGEPTIKGLGDWLILDAPTDGKLSLNDWESGDVIIANGGGNVGIGTTAPRTALDTGTGVMSGAANDYMKAQFGMSGGGTVTWGGPGGRLKWTKRFIAIAMEKGTSFASGHVDIRQPKTDIPAANVSSGAARSANTNGVVLNAWEALYAVHTVGGGKSAVSFRIVRFKDTFHAPSNWLLVAVVNDEDETVKLGTGVILSKNSSSSKGSPLPSGTILMWSGATNTIPDGWALCNGASSTPDLQNRFIVGAGNSYNPANTGGSNTVDLSVNQLPSHSHSANSGSSGWHSHAMMFDTGGGGDAGGGDMAKADSKQHGVRANYTADTNGAGNHSHNINISNTGQGGSHENRPPYYALAFIMKL